MIVVGIAKHIKYAGLVASEAGEGRPASDDAALLDALVQSSFTVIGIVSTVAARHDLSLTLLRVGAILRDRTPMMSELALHLGLDRSTITGLINRAVERGLIRRIENEEDRRSSRVMLTDAGQALAAVCAIEISTALAPLTDQLTSTERRHLARLLTQTLAVPDS